MKVAPGIYPINGAGPDDPCALTVDFALTYFLVSGELERSKIPVNLLITDASGIFSDDLYKRLSPMFHFLLKPRLVEQIKSSASLPTLHRMTS